MILEYATEADAAAGLSVINALAAAWWAAQGYTVIDEGEGPVLVGRNAATGEDDPSAARTTTWDVVRASPDGSWYFQSPGVDRWPGWPAAYANAGGPAYVERARPEAWDAPMIGGA